MPSCAGFLEPRKSRLRPLKSTFSAENSYTAFLCLSQFVSAQFAFEMCLAARNRQKSIKTPILAFKVIEFGGKRQPVYDFLSHSHGSVSVVRTTFKVYGKMQTLTLSQPKTPEPIVTKF